MAFIGGQYNCWDCCVAQVCGEFGIRYSELLLGSGALRYDVRNVYGSIGEKISVAYRSVLAGLKYSCGIDYSVETPGCNSEWLALVGDQLRQGSRTVALLDAYYWPLDRGYKRYHHSHFVIVKGIGAASGEILVDDPFNSKFGVAAPFDELKDGLGSLYVFSGSGSVAHRSQPWLPQSLSWPPPSELALQLEAMKSDLRQIDPTIEMQGFGELWWACPLINKLKRLITARKLWMSDDDLCRHIAPHLQKSTVHLDRLVVLLAATLQRRSDISNRISEQMDRIADCELQLSALMSDVQPRSPDQENDYSSIDLRSAYDAKTFGTFNRYDGTDENYVWLGHDLSSFDLPMPFDIPAAYEIGSDSVTRACIELPIDAPLREICLLYIDLSRGRSGPAWREPSLLGLEGQEIPAKPLDRKLCGEPHLLTSDRGKGIRTPLAGRLYKTHYQVPSSLFSSVRIHASSDLRLLKVLTR